MQSEPWSEISADYKTNLKLGFIHLAKTRVVTFSNTFSDSSDISLTKIGLHGSKGR